MNSLKSYISCPLFSLERVKHREQLVNENIDIYCYKNPIFNSVLFKKKSCEREKIHLIIPLLVPLYRDISFMVIFKKNSCNTINGFNEGVEFSYQLSSLPNEWIPIKFIYRDNRNSSLSIPIGDYNNFSIRGYTMFDVIRGSVNTVRLSLCGFNNSDSIRFRWLQTSQISSGSISRDVWILDDIVINIVQSQKIKVNLLHEGFNETQLK